MSYSLNTSSKFTNIETLKTQLDTLQTYVDTIKPSVDDAVTINDTNTTTLSTIQTTVTDLETDVDTWKYKSGTIHKIYEAYIAATQIVTLNSAVYQYFGHHSVITRELTNSRILVEVSFQATLSGLTGNEVFFSIFDNVVGTLSQSTTLIGPNYKGPVTLRWWVDSFEPPGATRTDLRFSVAVSSFNNVGLIAIKQFQWIIYEVNV